MIKLAVHSELTTKTDSVVIFSHSNRSSSLESSCQKRFFMVASVVLLSTSVFPNYVHDYLNIPGNQKWHFKEFLKLRKNGKCKISFEHSSSGHQIFAHNKMTCTFSVTQKKKFQRTSRVSSKPNETILIFATEQRWWWPFASLVRITVVESLPQKSHFFLKKVFLRNDNNFRSPLLP